MANSQPCRHCIQKIIDSKIIKRIVFTSANGIVVIKISEIDKLTPYFTACDRIKGF